MEHRYRRRIDPEPSQSQLRSIKIYMEISLIMPNRNNLKYFKWAYESIRKNQGEHTVWILSASDACTDGTLEHYEQLAAIDPHFKYLVNRGPDRLGHTILYDKIIYELCETNLAMIYHCDMYLCPGALDAIERLMYRTEITHSEIVDGQKSEGWQVLKNRKRIASLTRIEPPLHPVGREKIVMDFGTEPDNFDEIGLNTQLQIFEKLNTWKQIISADQWIGVPLKGTTAGVFAPWAFWVDEYKAIGGNDWANFSPQSKEDCCHSDTFIFIEIDGFCEYMTMRELWNRFESNKTCRSDGNFYIDFSELGIKIRCMSPYPNGKIGMGKINKILRKTVDSNRLVKIRTNWGEVVVTTDHSLIDMKLNGINIDELNSSNIWVPSNFVGDLLRPNFLHKHINFNNIGDIENDSNIRLSIIDDIDEYGNNQQLIDICEFFGFFVAEGSSSVSKNTGYLSICSTDLQLLNYMKSKSISLFGIDLWNDIIKSEKPNSKDVFHYRKTNLKLALFFKKIVGTDSAAKQVPNFIYNLPKVYQIAFLYGYLLGDGYLGTKIRRQKNEYSFSVDKKLFFRKNIFEHMVWKSTSKSEMLTAGINFLLKKCFPSIMTRIHFAKNKGKNGVYNLSTANEYRNNILEIIPYSSKNEFEEVFDLEVRGNNSFVGGIGLIGLHNSDIWNRSFLNGTEFLQTWEGFVYHLTCRGSRFNPTITTVGQNSSEWDAQNLKSSRNFIRKWGHFVRHDEYLKPEVPHKYDIACVVENCNYNLMANLEPWFAELQVDLSANQVMDYIDAEQPNTKYDLKDRIDHLPSNIENRHDIVCYIDGHKFNGDDFYCVQYLSDIITQNNPDDGCEFEVANIRLKVNRKKTYENELIICENEPIEL